MLDNSIAHLHMSISYRSVHIHKFTGSPSFALHGRGTFVLHCPRVYGISLLGGRGRGGPTFRVIRGTAAQGAQPHQAAQQDASQKH